MPCGPGLEARRATRGLAGWQRFADAARHAVLTSLASCVTAELADLLIRPGFLAGTAWLFSGSTASMWIGFAIGKAAVVCENAD